jgi:hypothetical protein
MYGLVAERLGRPIHIHPDNMGSPAEIYGQEHSGMLQFRAAGMSSPLKHAKGWARVPSEGVLPYRKAKYLLAWKCSGSAVDFNSGWSLAQVPESSSSKNVEVMSLPGLC